MSPLTSADTGDAPDLTAAFEALVDQFRALSARMAAAETALTGTVASGAGIVGPQGPPGADGAPGSGGGAALNTDDSVIQAVGTTASAGSSGKAADAAHVHVGSGGVIGGGFANNPYDQAIAGDTPVGYWPLSNMLPKGNYPPEQFPDSTANGLLGNIPETDDHGNNLGAIGMDGHRPSVRPAKVPTAFPTGVPMMRCFPLDFVLQFFGYWPIYGKVPGVGLHITDDNGQSLEWWGINSGPTANPSFGRASWAYSSFLWFSGSSAGYDAGTISGDPDFLQHHSAFCESDDPTAKPALCAMPAAGDAHHYVITRKTGGKYRMYINGALAGERSAGTFGIPDDKTLYVGGNPRMAIMLVGFITHIAIYNHELTEARVLAHYNQGIALPL